MHQTHKKKTESPTLDGETIVQRSQLHSGLRSKTTPPPLHQHSLETQNFYSLYIQKGEYRDRQHAYKTTPYRVCVWRPSNHTLYGVHITPYFL